MRRFRVPSLPQAGGPLTLDPAASHHLLRVLRQPRGASLCLFDGLGGEADAVLTDVTEGLALLQLGPCRRSPPAPPLHLVLALLKGPAMDHALRMAVETGATHIHPLQAARSVPKGDRQPRWQRILTAAGQQCGRAALPQLLPLAELSTVMQRLSGVQCFIALPGAEPPPPESAPAVAALIGPEGGFTNTEITRCLDSGALPMGLGPWVLRSDTATAVAVASLSLRQHFPATA